MKLPTLVACGIIAIADRAAEWKDLSQADDDSIIQSAKEDAAVLWYGAHQGFSHGSNVLENAWNGAVNLVFTKIWLEKQHNLEKDSSAKTLYGAELDKEYSKIVDAGGLENYDLKATPTPTPGPVTLTVVPMTKAPDLREASNYQDEDGAEGWILKRTPPPSIRTRVSTEPLSPHEKKTRRLER